MRLTKTGFPSTLASSSAPYAPAFEPFLPVENTMNATVSEVTARFALLLQEVADAPAALRQISMSLGRQLTPFALRLAREVKWGFVAVPVHPVTDCATA